MKGQNLWSELGPSGTRTVFVSVATVSPKRSVGSGTGLTDNTYREGKGPGGRGRGPESNHKGRRWQGRADVGGGEGDTIWEVEVQAVSSSAASGPLRYGRTRGVEEARGQDLQALGGGAAARKDGGVRTGGRRESQKRSLCTKTGRGTEHLSLVVPVLSPDSPRKCPGVTSHPWPHLPSLPAGPRKPCQPALATTVLHNELSQTRWLTAISFAATLTSLGAGWKALSRASGLSGSWQGFPPTSFMFLE